MNKKNEIDFKPFCQSGQLLSRFRFSLASSIFFLCHLFLWDKGRTSYYYRRIQATTGWPVGFYIYEERWMNEWMQGLEWEKNEGGKEGWGEPLCTENLFTKLIIQMARILIKLKGKNNVSWRKVLIINGLLYKLKWKEDCERERERFWCQAWRALILLRFRP